MLITGPSSSGKTVFLTHLLLRRHDFFNEQPKKIIWYYGTIDPPTIDIPDVVFKHGLPIESDVASFRDSIIILDDLMENAKSNLVTGLFSPQSLFHCAAGSEFLSRLPFTKPQLSLSCLP